MAPETCPNCGADVPSHSQACPECGADEETGWSDQATAMRLGIPDESFDHGEFVREEFNGRDGNGRSNGWRWWLVAVAIVLLLFFFLGR